MNLIIGIVLGILGLIAVVNPMAFWDFNVWNQRSRGITNLEPTKEFRNQTRLGGIILIVLAFIAFGQYYSDTHKSNSSGTIEVISNSELK